MSDQGHWFKLWISALNDPDLSNLSLEDFARWAILGTYIKAHGTDGTLKLTHPARALCAMFQVTDFDALRAVFHRLPNVREEMQKCNGEGETILTVTLHNWSKYQGDYSTDRVRKFREMKRSKRRGDEKRRDENKKRGEVKTAAPTLSQTDQVWLDGLKDKPAYAGIDIVREAGKCQSWCEANGKVYGRRRLVNWLNRCEKPITNGATGGRQKYNNDLWAGRPGGVVKL